MTREEAKKMAEAKLKCMERDISGIKDDCNNKRCYECSLNYEQGNMGEQKEWLRMAIKALEQEPTGHWIIIGDRYIKCSECGHITKTESPDIYNFCMVCGANMSEIPTSSKPEISSFYGLRSYVRKRSE